jgi:hypothetical protein
MKIHIYEEITTELILRDVLYPLMSEYFACFYYY